MIELTPADLQPQYVPQLDHCLVLLMRSAHAYRIMHPRGDKVEESEILDALDCLCSWALVVSALYERAVSE